MNSVRESSMRMGSAAEEEEKEESEKGRQRQGGGDGFFVAMGEAKGLL